MNSVQLCYITTVASDATYFEDEWKGESAGGNPTSVSWRKNPLYFVCNSGSTALEVVVIIKQEDQRRFMSLTEMTKYLQCGMVLIHYSYANPIPTFWVTGNNHKPIHKSLFLNSREVANTMTIPPNSLCYLVPSCMHKGVDGPFSLALYRMKDVDYSDLTITKLAIPSMNWSSPATKNVELCQKEKDRVDFYVDEATDVHILLHQTKPYVSKSGGDAMTEDYMGMYLYDDTDRRVAGVHAATNFREMSVIHRLPRSGRYAISITCPRAKSDVPAYITIIGSHASNVRIVDPPEDATMFDDEDIIDEGEDAALEHNPVDYTPVVFDAARHGEQVESDSPFEDKRFYMDNRGATSDPWVHIGDLYPEGKTVPLLPNELRRDQFGQGDHYDCSTLTAFAALLERHPDVIRNCFVSKNPRKDGRYTFQFHRYGQWVKVEIDDRIPMVKDDTVFCRSPTHHWWPLLLEKAYAKFYTLYENLEGISQEEVFHDYTGQPCLSVSTDPEAARVNMSYFDEVPYWMELASMLPNLSVTALASGQKAEAYGLLDGQYYALLEIISGKDTQRVSDVLVKMYNPYEDSPYIGPMNAEDSAWTSELQRRVRPERELHVFYIPAHHFVAAFSMVQMGYAGGLAEPSWHFNSEWAQGTNGGDTSFVSWRENPLYIFSNPTEDPVQIIGMVRQPDQRHLLHTLPNQELAYPKKGLAVAQANPSAAGIPTHLVTLDNHRFIHREMLLPVREVTNVLTIPPQSVCYVVGYCHSRVISKFLLSYWFMRDQDIAKLSIERYRPKVAKHQPAIAHVDLYNRAKERVDFLVDTPTEVHAVFKQAKVFHSPHGGDVLAEDYVGVYLYDLQNNRIKGIQSAMNYRELSLVAHLTEPGHYVFFSTCPRGNGDVPCRVEICAVEKAHVRITDPPEDAIAMSEPDMAFLDAFPEGIPLSELPIDSDPQFQDDVTELGRLLSDPSARAEEIEQLKNRMSKRVRELAKAHLARDRPIYLSGRDLSVLNPVVDNDEAYMNAERERYYLKQDLRNHYKLLQQEDELRGFADSAFERHICTDFSFIEARPEGIPRNDIPLASDKAFAEMMQERVGLRRRPKENASAIGEIEARMGERAREIARAMHDAERVYLNLQPTGVPLDLVPLNTDAQFGAMEDELRALLRSPITDHSAITALHDHLNEHAHNLAREVRRSERVRFLKSEDADRLFPILDNDPEFTAKEIQRLRALKENPERNATSIENLENDLNERAAQLSNKLKQSDRAFLIPYGVELDLISDTLDGNSRFRQKENHLRELRENPQHNSSNIEALQNDMAREALLLTTQYKSQQRPTYLEAEYEGRPMETLPLDDDAAFRDAETAYLGMCESGNADPAALQRLVGAMRERATDIARGMNAADRPKYLPKAVRGVPLRALALDDDEEFRHVEQERARAVCASGHEAEAAALEARLLARAGDLAQAQLTGDRGYLEPEPAGIPLELVPLDEDAEFRTKEAERAELKENPTRDLNGMALKEAELNTRAVELAQQLKDGERGKVLAELYDGIPTSELPLDTDAAFHEMEVDRLRRVRADPDADWEETARLEDAMRTRARELAASMKASERGLLLEMQTLLTADRMNALLDSDATAADMERRLRELRKSPNKNAAAIKALEEEMRKRAERLAGEYLAEVRPTYLEAEYEGRPMETLPLDDDAAFRDAETAYLGMCESGNADPAALQRLVGAMRERATDIARGMNAADRPKYLPKAVRGVPLRALALDDDEEFRHVEQERARAVCASGHEAEAAALEARLLARAGDLAQAQLTGDRGYLEPEPAGIPLELVPLDEDAEFRTKEAERAELKENPTRDLNGMALKEAELNTRAVELAQRLKDGERGKVLAELYDGIPTSELPLDTDAAFHEMEVDRLRRVRADPDADWEETARLEDAMRTRARELAASMKASERGLLLEMQTLLTADRMNALLDSDATAADMERRLRELRKSPNKNAAAIKALEEEMRKRAERLAGEYLAEVRPTYLEAEYEGRPMETLPLDDDAAFRDAETAYLGMCESGNADPAALQRLVGAMRERATDIARGMNAADRPKYLPKAVRGVPLRALALDDDEEFRHVEQERARAVCASGHEAEAAALEARLLARAGDLAQAQLTGDRGYLEPEPAGIPLELVPLDEDAEFRTKEAERAELKENPTRDLNGMALKEAELNTRAVELAQRLKDGERGKVLAELYDGIPTSELPLDTDAAFHEMEVDRLRRVRADPDADWEETARLEDAMRTRARELAASMKASERGLLLEMQTLLTADRMNALLDSDATAADMERRLRELRKSPNKNAAAIKALEEEMRKRAERLAGEYLAEVRPTYLEAEYEGRPMETLPLDDDAAFRDAETAYLGMCESGNADPAALQRLVGAMRERATDIARGMNAADRPKYLPKAVRGVPLRALALDDDEEFRHVEQERARAVCASGHEAEAAALEARLLARAVELASLHLCGDRAFLDQNPEGIPLAALKLDDDDLFRAKEEQRASLLGDGLTEANRFAIAVFEESMNQQVHDMAKRLKALLIGQHVPEQVRGIPREVIPLLADERSSEIIAELTLCASGPALVKQVALLKARAEELVDAGIEGIRSRLDVAPVHVQLSYLPLDEDESFKTLEIEALVEVQKPKPDAATVQDLIGALNCRARELAEQLCWEERKALMDSNPEGRALRSLPLNTDTIFLSAEAKHRAEAKVESSDVAALRVLMEEMAARAQQLALEANRKDRVSFVSAVVRGVALHDLPLDDDDAFRELERKRAMALQDPKQSAATVPAIEEALRSRADALATSVLRNDRTFLDSRPEGVPLRQVPIDSDRRFQQLEEQRAQLRTSFREAGADFSTGEVKAIERMMNERVHEMANGVKPLLRNQLAQTVLGISLKDLPLDTDAVFSETEERCRDAEAAGDDKAATALKSDLNARATTLAEAMHKAERAALWQVPEGVPLEALPLNSDDVFLDLEREARLIRHIAAAVPSRHQRSSDVTKLAALIAELNRRACILANESRLAYCDAEPEGIPLETLQLASQPEFIGKEEERRHLVKTHGVDSDPVRSCNAELRKMAYTIARSRVQGDRGFLDSDPEGVPLSVLPLDEDAAFHSMEVERARLKAQNTSAAASKAKALEEKLNERVHDLARLQKEEDLRGIDPAPHGIPLAVLQPHSDGTFASMVDLLRALKLESPAANADKICGLQADMNGRCLALAKSRVADDRAFLDADPEGVPLVLLPLDMDAAFQELETQRANLKSLDPIRNAAAVKELEDRLNERAHELAMDHITQELDGLTPEPFDVPLEVLRPYEDPSFKQAVAALRQLHTTNKADPTVASIKAAMEERCQTMAHDLLEKDRGYLHDRPKNVSLSLLPLNSDEAFHAGEVRRALLKAENARRNADKITELEGQLNLRAMELAELRRTQDMVGLDAEPAGVPLRVIDPHADAAFAALVEKRRALEVEQPASKTPSPQLAQVVSAMNCRAHELAKGILEGDRRYLDQDPEGVPLEVLPFDTDKVFHAMEVERAAMKAADPKRNAGRIRELEEKLNDRAHELAQVQKDEELCGLDPTPRGISLKLLRPHEDPLFSELVKQMRVMKKNPPRDDQEMVRHLEEMNARAAALADKVMDRGYLDPNPEGVLLQELPLETDDKFRSMEMERARLKLTDPRGQSAMISSLESALNQRAEELAKRQCVADLASVEDAPLEVAKELLRLHSDAEGATLIEDLRQLRKNPGRNAGVLRQKEAALNDRAFEVARKLLVGDRANYIDPRPRNIPLEDLPLEKDEMFHALEVERVVLKLTDPIHNAAAVRNTESTLNDRAYQLAELVMKEDLAGFPPSYHGILTKDLNPHSDRIFSETAEKRRFRIRVPTVTFKEDLEQIMDDRLSELARERKDGELYFMNPSPEGVLLADLPLSTDTLFNNMCQERQQLKEKDAMENRKAVVTLEDEMNKRAAVLARSVLNSDFDGVDKAPLGIPLDLLRPRQNAEVARLIPELRRCKRAAQLKNKVAGLQAKMNECVRVLAAAALEEGRDKYLDAHPEGVPLELLPLRTDDVFHDKEAQRATLRLQDPVKHAGAITQLESQLNAQAHKLALRQKEEDLVGVDLAPRGIPLAFLHPHEDAKMMGFIKDVRVLKTDPLHNKDNIRWQQQQMNERAHELATLALNGDREYLRPNPLGVSLTVLPLDEDPAFHEAEVARVVAKRQPHPNSKAIALLEQQLNARAEELAAAQLQCDVEGLEQAPLGVPLSLLKPHADSTFAELLPELRRLEKDPARNATKLKQLRAAANECNYELAEAFLAKDRSTYMGAEPEGVPLHLLKLTADDEFKALENKRLQLHSMQQAGRTVNAKDFSALDALLKERAHEVAKQLLRKDRGYLDPFPEGVALDILPLDSDPAFRRLETTRAAAKYRNTITQANDLEDQLNARARELALAQKEEDLRGLDQHPHDLPLTLLQPHQDAQFEQLVDELRRLKASHGDQRKAVKEVQDRLNNRSYAMADRVTKGDRRYLHPKPENVPLSRLPLGTDATFHALEIERAMLKLKEPRKNQHRIADMEDQLNSRAAELAKAVKMEDLKSLAQTPRGIPVELLKLHEDPKFSALIAEKEQLPKGRSGEVTATLLNSMNECALEVADKLLRGDRGYLNRELEGALLPCLPLDTDMAFHEMEVERAKLKVRDPVKNASVIDDLEDQLTKRAHELMSAVLVMDRDYLNPSPEGVPIEELLLDTDSKFHSMEVERAKLKVRDLQGNAARIKDLEGYLNDHAAGLAKQQLEEDLKGLDREPEGYPLKCLRPHSDAAFAAVVVSLRRAKMEPLGNVAKVHEAQATLNARAHELARERIAADRARLNQEPEKVPLALLPLEKDAQFAAVEKELRMLKAADKPNLKAITEVEGQMNDRAHVLARAYLKQSRDFLDQEPEGVALDYVPLDKDTHFCALERDRLCLLAKGASLSSAQVRAMEERLNDRAHELAAKVKTKGRDFLRSQSSDIPKELLALDADKVFVAKEKELRKHQQQLDGPHSLNTVANLRRELQQRADEVSEAQLKGDRGKYLDLQPEGVDLCDIPLDTDHIYHGMEVERAILLADDATGRKPTVAELEKKLNTRAHELAHQIIVSDRYYLPEEVYGIPVEELPLATDSKFNKLERQRRVHKRSSNMRKEVAADEEELRCHAQELAKEVIALDLEPIKASYRGIPKVELNLHADSAFRELAKKRRRLRGKGRVEATEMTAIEDEMDRRACEIADDVINNERAFLDPEPEGMYLIDVPLDDDQAFQQLEQEYRRRRRDPRTAKQNGSVLRELAEEMNQRSHTLARATFAKTRGFMKQEPEGIPLVELGLDEDPEFKEAEIARYRTNRSVVPNAATVAEMEVRMDGRARELARATLAADRAFLDPKPEGVSLEVLPLDSDMEFSDLARERRRRKKILKGGVGEAEVRAVEEKMNARSHEMAKEFLEMERAFLSREPEGVPLADLPLNADPLFRTMENERLRLKRDPLVNTAMLAAKEADLEHRAHVIAKDLLRKERAFLDPEPLSVPLEELPLNYDDVLNPVERKRRVLRMHPKRNHAAIRTCEEQMADRVGQIAVNFVY
ncbi:putative calpain-like cysteine peptidase [Leishmania braziliensis MHOM/BR/75/M2904]|uniref:Calpain-like cysteine peptidase n=1 Tax=Leishmania braziliensis TaxID=5660 RepID=A4HFX3_LEIBR|nr:putative calpain-like cysteine peptidase [Leishmania braziliensis MHOM/BR/75/M2904]CAM45491.2 putative calpain-like cysteine peptidase [Leishmania braziliensis MHOM/BR/75/M2904]